MHQKEKPDFIKISPFPAKFLVLLLFVPIIKIKKRLVFYMTHSEEVLLSLIRKSLFGSEEIFSSDTDWNEVLQEATAQAVIGITAKALPKNIPSTVSSEWHKLAYSQLANTIRYWQAQDDLHHLLTENGISYVILKGAAAAMLYPAPLFRAMGDIDFLVTPEQFDQTKELLEENGYQHLHEESDRHIAFSKNLVSYELHYRFSYDDLDIEDSLQSAIPHAELHQVSDHAFYALPAKENGLVLLAHFWSHLHTGIGLRQVLDWMLFVQAILNDDFWNGEFFDLAKQYRLQKTAITATRMCQKYFLLPTSISWCLDADESLCDELMGTVLESGNFGQKRSAKDTKAEAKAKTALAGLYRYGFFHHLQKRGESNWTAYHKNPWLKPFAWLYQLFRYVFLWLSMPKEEQFTSLFQKGSETNDLLKRLDQ